MEKLKNFVIDALLALDRLANRVILGDPRETISSRMARNMSKTKWAYIGCKMLDIILFDRDHCQEAKTKLDNLKTNDHPVIFFGIALVLGWVLYRAFIEFFY